MNEQPRDEAQARLADLDEGVALPNEQPPKRSRKKAVIVFFALLVLAAVTCVGGYALLRGKQVDLKANKRLPEKPTSGSDIQKAAFDSIRDSLTTPSSTPSSGVPGGNQAIPISSSSGERVAPPIEPGIAATLAPPPEVLAKPTPQAIGATQPNANGAAKTPIALTTTQSVRFAAPPKSLPLTSTSKPESPVQTTPAPAEEGKPTLAKRTANLPSFGAMLPVRLMGALYTLRTGSLARFELMRDLKTDTWQMRRGTIFIGNVAGGGADRAFVQIKGFIDPGTERLVKIEGELLGDDGGAGLRGKQRRVSSVWVKVLDRAAQAGVQIATSILNSRASSVIIATDPYRTIRSQGESQSQNNRSFVEVPAGAVGFVMVTTLPQQEEPDSHLAESGPRKNDFADQDLVELMTSADPARIRAALPRMTAELRQIAEMVIKEIEAAGK